MATNIPKALPDDRIDEFNTQLTELLPLAKRFDRCLSGWEIDFLLALSEARDKWPTLEQGNKLNQIYETKYLRGSYG